MLAVIRGRMLRFLTVMAVVVGLCAVGAGQAGPLGPTGVARADGVEYLQVPSAAMGRDIPVAFLAGGPHRGEGLVSAPDPADRPALALARALLAVQAPDLPEGGIMHGGPAQSWMAAAQALGAAMVPDTTPRAADAVSTSSASG